ncbi:methyl-accepting chemotaxis protein [Desulfomonile tiedjei]|uniref:Methyl-accepting chemotaxis protein n=1 Tax=Desulfomonile tiedjei (strain ATCC 49306 / DSM 6799 / DCB-1) TaxID=706587 RepID=I4C258_DESTA|nr:methyl-accepting chemotaxis protein [Desulfomonile tiedjei]AFM23649.1 methyl-accepting chemotaxis protein [Desulfomonile tiedjei DSM 6799]
MKLSDIGLKVKVMGGGLIPVILAAILCMVVLYSVHALLQNVESVDQTHRAIRETVELQFDTMGMLAWLRAFHAYGDERFVPEYKNRLERIDKEFADLKRIVGDGDEIKYLIQAQEVLADARKRFELGVELQREINAGKSLKDVAALVAADKEQSLSRLRNLIKEFVEKQQSLPDKFPGGETRSHVEGQTAEIPAMSPTSTRLQAMEIYTSAMEMENLQRGYLLAGTDEFLKSYEDASKRMFALIEKQKQKMSGNITQLRLLADIEDTLRTWVKEIADPQIALRKQVLASKTVVDLNKLVAENRISEKVRKYDELLATFKEAQEKALQERRAASEKSTNATERALVLGLILVIASSLFISYLIARAIANTVGQAVDLAEAISKGDLTRSLQKRGEDEVGRLTQALNDMVEFLREQTRRTIEGVNVLGSSAAEIAATVSQLAGSTARTSSAVTETITTIEEVKHAAKISNDTAKKVAESSKQAVDISEIGKKATSDTAHRMNLIKEQIESIGETVIRLSEHSQAIEEIIGTVQDLADQSNLLAVNASIEAARAGDHGKGFAVVALEIKTLADQSKSATEQVRRILEETKKWVSAVVMATEQGTKAVDAGVNQSIMAGESIESLFGSVSTSSQAATVIHSTTEQQLAGVDQVSTAMLNIEQAMQQNVSSISQLDEAAKRIEELGSSLKDLVERTRVR